METRQTHHLRLPQQNTPLPVQHLRQRGPPPIPVPRPPLVRRTTKNSCRPWNVRRNPENFPTYSGGLRARHSPGSRDEDAHILYSRVSFRCTVFSFYVIIKPLNFINLIKSTVLLFFQALYYMIINNKFVEREFLIAYLEQDSRTLNGL